MPDNVLKIVAEFDVSQLVAASKEAAAALDSIGKGVAQNTLVLAGSSKSLDDVRTGLINLGHTAPQASEAVKILSQHLGETAPSAEKVNTALNAMERQMAQGTVRILAMDGGVGGLGYALGRVAAMVPGLGEVLAGAFSVVGVVAFAQIIVDAGEKLYHLYQNAVLLKTAIDDLDKAGVKEAQTAAELNSQYVSDNAALLARQHNFAAAADAMKKAADEKPLKIFEVDDKNFKQFNAEFVTFMQAVHTTSDAPTVISRLQKELTATTPQLDKAKSQLADLQKELLNPPPVAPGAASPLGVLELEITHTTALIADLQKKSDLLTTAIGQVQSQTGATAIKLQSDLTNLANEQTRIAGANAEAQITATLKGRQAEIELREEQYKRQYAMAQISLAQETALHRAAEAEKLRDLTAADNALIAEKQREAKADPTLNVQPEIIRLLGEEKTARENAAREDVTAQTAADEQLRKQTEELADSEVQNHLKIAESIVRLATTREQFALKKADTPAEVEAAAIPMIATANDLYNAQITALERRRAILASGPQTPDTAKALADVGTQEIDAYMALQDQKIRIADDTQDRLDTINKSELSDEITAMQDQLAQVRANAGEQLAVVEQMNEQKKMDGAQYVAAVKRNADMELAAILETYKREVAATRQAAEDGTISEAEATKRITEYWKQADTAIVEEDKKVEQAHKRVTEEMIKDVTRYVTTLQSQLNRGFLSAIEGQDKLGVAMAKAWDQMVLKAIDSVMKIAENYLAGLVLQQGAQEKQVLMDAKTAAANAWSTAPNPIVGAIEAAATFAAIVATYTPTFEHGGVVPGAVGIPMPAVVHGGERYLTPSQNTNFERLVNQSTTRQTTYHNYRPNITVQNNAGTGLDELVAAVRQGMRMGH